MNKRIENSKAQMRKGTLEFCTLLAMSKRPLYAAEVIEELKNADLLVVEGTIYPLLSRLKRDGLVSYEWQESQSGPPRKYYALTVKGKDATLLLSASWKVLSKSINKLISSYEKNN